MGRLDGKVALVTGAASGIGEATALAVRRRGRAVVGLDVNVAPRSDEVTAVAPGVSFHIADVTDEAAVAAAIAEASTRTGGSTWSSNYAGVAGGGPVHMVELAEFRARARA